MARLPTVKIRQKLTGNVRIVDQTEYARDLGKYHDWDIISSRHGDAPDAIVERAARQAEKELARASDPTHPASGDAERRYEHNQGRPVIVSATDGKDAAELADEGTEPVVEPAVQANVEAAVAGTATLDPNWRDLDWLDQRKHLHAVTGKNPRSKASAEKIEAAYLKERAASNDQT